MADTENSIFNEQLPLVCKIKIGDKTYYIKDNDARSVITELTERVGELETDYSDLNTALSDEIERAKAAENVNAAAIKAIADDYLKAADKTALEAEVTAEQERAEAAESALDAKIAAIKSIEIKVVAQLPETGEDNVIYLVPHTHGEGDIYDEYVWVKSENKFEKIGSTDIKIDETTFVFKNNLETMYTLGKYNGTLANPQTIPTAGKTFAEAWDTIFKKEENPKTTQPSLTIGSSNIGEKEAGTHIQVAYTTTFGAGSYTYGPATGVTASDYKIKFNGETLTGTSGTFASMQVQDSTSLKITGTYDHTAGAMPVTNIGNNYPAGQIAAANDKAATEKGTLTGYRNMFYGTVAEKGTIDGSAIRALTAAKQAAKANNSLDVTIPVGALRVIIAVPNDNTSVQGKTWTRSVDSIHDRNGLGAEIFSSFTETTVSVPGANNFTAINYKVYYLDYANPNDKLNHYDVTVK